MSTLYPENPENPENPEHPEHVENPEDPGPQRDAQHPATGRGGMNQVLGEDFDAMAAVGGVRGLVEAVAPGAVFIVAFVATGDLAIPLIASLAVAALATVIRLLQRTPVTQAVGGLLGVGVGVLMAWRSGQAEDFYLWGLLTNAVYVVGILAALLARWPVIGVIVSVLRGQDMSWRIDPARRAERQAYTYATWAWVALFAARLLVQVPLYLGGYVAALGIARLVMGVPLWAANLWLTWLLVRAVLPPRAGADRAADAAGR